MRTKTAMRLGLTLRKSVSKRIGAALKFLIPLIVALSIGRLIYGNWRQVSSEPWQLDSGYLILSFVLASGWFLARPLGWMIVINGFGHSIPFGEIYRVYRKSELSRYVPGGVWQFASRVYLTRRYGVEPAVCLAATLVDMTLAALAALGPAVWALSTALPQLGGYQRGVLTAFPLLAFAVVHPRVLNAWAGLLSRLLKQPYTPIRISAARLFGVWAIYLAAWVGLAAAMAFFARALLPSAGSLFALIACSYALAWLTALLTMVAPAGMGIREGILGLLLSRVLTAGTGLTLAVAMRLWLVAMELVWWAAGRWFPPRRGA